MYEQYTVIEWTKGHFDLLDLKEKKTNKKKENKSPVAHYFVITFSTNASIFKEATSNSHHTAP